MWPQTTPQGSQSTRVDRWEEIHYPSWEGGGADLRQPHHGVGRHPKISIKGLTVQTPCEPRKPFSSGTDLVWFLILTQKSPVGHVQMWCPSHDWLKLRGREQVSHALKSVFIYISMSVIIVTISIWKCVWQAWFYSSFHHAFDKYLRHLFYVRHCGVGRNLWTSDMAYGLVSFHRAQKLLLRSATFWLNPLVTRTHLPPRFGWPCSANSRRKFSECVKCKASRKNANKIS